MYFILLLLHGDRLSRMLDARGQMDGWIKFINATASVTLAPQHRHADMPAAAVSTGTAAGRTAELRHRSTAQSSTAGLVHRSRSTLPPSLPAPEIGLQISSNLSNNNNNTK